MLESYVLTTFQEGCKVPSVFDTQRPIQPSLVLALAFLAIIDDPETGCE